METAQKERVYSAEDFYYSGVADVKAGETQTAIDDFTKAIEQEPSYAEAHLARADVYAKLKKAEPAHDDYIRAAEIFRFQKNFNRAITAYNSAVGVNKKSVTAYLGRGDLYLAKGQEIAAIADYDTARKINKKNPAVHFGLGKARFQLDNHKRAIKHFKEARSLDGNNPVIYQYLMLSYLAVDNVKEVKKNFKKFAKVANDAEMERMVADHKYSAVLHVVDED
jgi:tetratricopeptide (TPR) repeat protein